MWEVRGKSLCLRVFARAPRGMLYEIWGLMVREMAFQYIGGIEFKGLHYTLVSVYRRKKLAKSAGRVKIQSIICLE
jgi:hypothetical protein